MINLGSLGCIILDDNICSICNYPKFKLLYLSLFFVQFSRCILFCILLNTEFKTQFLKFWSLSSIKWWAEMDSKIQRLIRLYVSLHFIHVVFNNMVGWNGLEPSTSRLSAECSNQLSYQPIWWRWTGSNRWPPACKAGALPAELHPHLFPGPYLNLKN